MSSSIIKGSVLVSACVSATVLVLLASGLFGTSQASPAAPDPNHRAVADPCSSADVNEIDPNITLILNMVRDRVDPNMLKQLQHQLIANASRAEANVTPDANEAKFSKVVPQTQSPKENIKALAKHAMADELLSTYVNGAGLVDYKTLRRKRGPLVTVIDDYAVLDPNVYSKWSKADALAFWINAYNLCEIKFIIDNYPIQASRFKTFFYPANSIMQLSDQMQSSQFRIMGENYTLIEMEQKILRHQFGDPRLCSALTYSAMGSGPLRREPYSGKLLDAQLDSQMSLFLSLDKAMRIDRDSATLYLSPIFEWYKTEITAKYPQSRDFGDRQQDEASLLEFISKYLPKKDADWLKHKNFKISYMRFNWALNEQH
jgi:hypothetical protein